MSQQGVDFGINLTISGSDQVAAGVGKAAAATQAMERATSALGSAQAALATATARTQTAQEAYDKALSSGAATANQLAAAQSKVAQAQASQVAAAIKVKDAQAQLQRQTETMAGASRLAGHQAAQLSAQMQDLFVQIQAGGNPMTALIQQGSQLSAVFGGIRPALAALASLMSPVAVAVGTAVAAVGSLAYGFVAGRNEASNFARVLSITGNAAGVTRDRFDESAKSISEATKTSIGSTRETLQALIASGRVSGGLLESMTEASQRMAKLTRTSSEDTTKALLSLVGNVTQGAAELNKTYHMLTPQQFKQVKSLEDTGRAGQALSIVVDALNKRFGDTSNLNAWQRSIDAIGNGFSSFVNKLKGIGNLGDGATVKQQIERLREGLVPESESANSIFATTIARQNDKLREQIELLRELQRMLNRAAAAKEAEADRSDAGQKLALIADQFKSPGEKLKEDLAKLRELGADANLLGRAVAHSQANALAVAANLARLSAQATIDAARLGATVERIHAQRAQDLITEEEALDRIAEAELRASYAEEDRIKKAINLAKGLPNSRAQVEGLMGQLDAQYIKSQQIQDKASDDKATRRVQVEVGWRKALVAVMGEEDRARQQMLAGHDKTISAQADTIQGLQDELVGLREGEEALRKRVALRDMERAAALEAQAVAALVERNDAAEYERLRQIAGQLAGIVELRGQVADAKLVKEQADKAAQAWQTQIDDIRSGLTDAFRRAFEAGEDFGTAFARTVANEIKTRIAVALAQSLANTFLAYAGIGAAGGGAGAGAPANAQGYAALLQTGTNLYRYGTNAYNWATGSGAAMYSTSAGTVGVTGAQGAFVGEGAASGVAAWDSAAAGSSSFSGAGSMSWGPWAALAVAAYMQASKDYREGFRGAQTRDAIDRYGPGITAFGGTETYVAEIMRKTGFSDRLAEMLSGSTIAARTWGRAAPRITATGVSGTIGGGDFSGQSFADVIEKGGWFRSDKRYTETAAVPEELGRMLDDASKAILDKAKDFGKALGLPVDALAGITADIRVELGDDLDKNKESLVKALGGYGDALVAGFADAVKPLANYGETTAETIARVGAAIADVNDVLQTLGLTALQASVDGGKAAIALHGLFGGADSLRQAAGGYLQNFYSDTERADLTRSAIAKRLAGVGIDALPASRAAFRDLVEAQDPMKESGRNAIAALLGVADAFASVTDAARSSADILNERKGLERQILEAQGDTAAIRALERAELDESNRALYDRLTRLRDERDAADAAARSLEKLNSAIDSSIDEFLSPRQRIDRGLSGVQSQLAGAGVNFSVAQLSSARQQDIFWFTKQFLELSGASDEAKRAVVVAAGSLEKLRQSANDLATTAIESELDEIGRTFGDVIGALAGDTETLADAYRRSGNELQTLRDGLDQLLGRATQTVQQALGQMLQSQAALKGYRSGSLADTIEQARLQGMTPAARVAALRSKEAILSAQIGSAADPVAVAQRLQSIIIERIRLESQLSTQVYDDQIDALMRLRDLSADIRQTVASLRFSDLSPLSPGEQLAQAQSLFDSTIAAARGGDKGAQGRVTGNLQALLQEAESFFGHAGGYSAIFSAATAAAEGLAALGDGADPQIAALSELRDTVAGGSDATVAALTSLDALLGSREEANGKRIDAQIKLAEDQISALKDLRDNQERQLRQQAAHIERLKEDLKSLQGSLDGIGSTLDRELVGGP